MTIAMIIAFNKSTRELVTSKRMTFSARARRLVSNLVGSVTAVLSIMKLVMSMGYVNRYELLLLIYLEKIISFAVTSAKTAQVTHLQ